MAVLWQVEVRRHVPDDTVVKAKMSTEASHADIGNEKETVVVASWTQSTGPCVSWLIEPPIS